ncbi:hypothetical protein E2562_012726 [Oryza meyeriana var. granulata]|uniref:Terpene synthase N-terminal domain-containing protein n=1 Tax=Oryza meyeriana var. granulata TaxID=110450 RepID=A0A6G1DHJ4_9ORYZ|nr:hypothetical protein E2562_012726 [Oryza meyeriana var. granulata]
MVAQPFTPCRCLPLTAVTVTAARSGMTTTGSWPPGEETGRQGEEDSVSIEEEEEVDGSCRPSLPKTRRTPNKLYSNAVRSKEWIREQADRLKRQVCYKILKTTSVADTVTLVDVLERLGIDNHFRDEIAAALHLVHREEQKLTTGADDGDQLHIAFLRFRLLRQHGLLN